MLGVQKSQYEVLLTPMVLGKLPMECHLEWTGNSLRKEGDFDFLLNSLQEELKRRDRATCYSSRERESVASRAHSVTPPPSFGHIDQPPLHYTARLRVPLLLCDVW